MLAKESYREFLPQIPFLVYDRIRLSSPARATIAEHRANFPTLESGPGGDLGRRISPGEWSDNCETLPCLKRAFYIRRRRLTSAHERCPAGDGGWSIIKY